MEAWRLLISLAGMLVLYAVLAAALGFKMSAVDLVAAIVFGTGGLLVGEFLTNRMNSDGK